MQTCPEDELKVNHVVFPCSSDIVVTQTAAVWLITRTVYYRYLGIAVALAVLMLLPWFLCRNHV